MYIVTLLLYVEGPWGCFQFGNLGNQSSTVDGVHYTPGSHMLSFFHHHQCVNCSGVSSLILYGV